MIQRLGIADALRYDPDVLILDEPTTAIDPLGVSEILELLRRLVNERGMAILLSSHLLNQVQSVCDRIGIFAAGRLIGQGTMRQLAERFGEGAMSSRSGSTSPPRPMPKRARSVLRAVPVAAIGLEHPARRSVACVDADGADAATVRSAVLAAGRAPPAAHVDPGRRPILEDIHRRAVAALSAQRAVMASRATRGRRTTSTPTVEQPVETAVQPSDARASIPRAGWMVIAAKEFGEYLLSSRFTVAADPGTGRRHPDLPRDRADQEPGVQ